MIDNKVIECYVEMRDGVKLYTIIQLPHEGGRFPVIVKRNPYMTMESNIGEYQSEDTHGYAVVIQHCRGTAKSEGICVAYKNERNDGLDLLDWIRKQPFYNGELYLMGGSYCCSVHLSYINTDPPDVKAAFLAIQDSERYNVLYRNGVYKTGLHGGLRLDYDAHDRRRHRRQRPPHGRLPSQFLVRDGRNVEHGSFLRVVLERL